MLTSEQIRAARAMLRMEQSTLAELSEVSVETIKRLEKLDRPLNAQIATLARLKKALEHAGVQFSDQDQEPGVSLAKDRHAHHRKAIVELVSSIVHSFLEIEEKKNPDFYKIDQELMADKLAHDVANLIKFTLPKRI